MTRRLFLLLALLAFSAALQAKGPTVKLTITRPGIAVPIDIEDPALLDGSNVFGGSFLGETLQAAPQVVQPIYTVSFHVRSPAWMRRPVTAMYAVSVARDARTAALWLYLPGRGEAGYALNVGTIMRDGQDGHWHRPPHAWAAAIAKYVP